jgi:hypothetical protein
VIFVKLAPEPATFDRDVRQPGLRAIAELCGKKPKTKRSAGKPFKKLRGVEHERDIPPDRFPPYWVDCLDELMSAYDQICAYSCFRIHPVTGARSADHFVARSRSWRRVYEWSNYRLCSSRLNARKNDFSGVLDPFQIKPGWFQLELLGFEVQPDPSLPESIRKKVQRTIDRLHLNDFRHAREERAALYRSGEVSLRVLKMESPFVAFELHRQGRLNPGDVW